MNNHGRGGARNGAGRKKISDKPTSPITVSLTEFDIEILGRLVDLSGKSRSMIIRELIRRNDPLRKPDAKE